MNFFLLEIREGKEYKLTQNERGNLEAHIQKLEIEIMKHFDVIVSTIGALADRRVDTWSKDRLIKTVILDEAGQLSHPSTLLAFITRPKRIVILGDHIQLKSTVVSFSAEIAGLDRSIMDWVSYEKYVETSSGFLLNSISL